MVEGLKPGSDDKKLTADLHLSIRTIIGHTLSLGKHLKCEQSFDLWSPLSIRLAFNRNGLVGILGLLWQAGHSRNCCQMWTAEPRITVVFKEKKEKEGFHHSVWTV